MKRSFFCLLLLTTGCTQLQGPYSPPKEKAPDEWKNSDLTESAEIDQWWFLFEDPLLNDLISQTIENNRNEAAAYERVVQAYTEARYRFGALFPVISLAPFYFKQGSLNAGTPEEAQNNQGTTPIVPPIITNNRSIFTEIELPLTISWELDLWGKLIQNYLDAYYTFESVTFDLQQLLNQLTTDVATNYYLLRGYDSEIDLLERLIASRQDNLDVNQERYRAGLINYLDVTRAEVDLGSAKSEKESVILQRELQENILALLVGLPASSFSIPHHPLPLDFAPPIIPAGIPSELLRRRPDISSKERKMASFHAQIGVAYSNFFPDILLSGEIGFLNNTFYKLFDWKARLWEMALSSTQILYNGGRLQQNAEKSLATYRESIYQYQESVLESFKDVEDALSMIRQRTKQEEDMLYTTRAAEETYDLAIDRYNSGLINYLDVVVAERDLLTASRSLTTLHAQRFTDTALLIKALGGGW